MLEVVIFLCLDHPIVIRTTAIILIRGCSNEVSRAVGSLISPKDLNPREDTKYKTSPNKSWIWVKIKANKAIFLSFPVNSLFENSPIKALITAIAKNKITKY